jgi:serine phosphatase RsbU (regulator of sigma subunit)
MPSIEQAQKVIFELLKDFEEDTLNILKNSPVALRIMRTEDKHIIFANPRYMEMFEVTKKDLQNLTPLRVYRHAADFEALSLRLEKQENIIDEILAMKTLSGISLQVMGSFHHLRYMDQDVVLAWFYDITAAHRAKEIAEEAAKSILESQKALANEISEAAAYIHSLLPKPINDGAVKTSWKHVPSSALGGDAFGYHYIDKDNLAIFLIDVCGHGVGSAMLCISAINSIRSQSLTDTDFKSPSSVLNGLNKAFPMEEQNLKYFTIWYGVYSPSSGVLKYASAGHPHAILIHDSDKSNSSKITENKELKKLATKRVAIGCFDHIDYIEETVHLNQNSKLYVFSDGVYEITDKKGIEMTLENFTELIMKDFNDLKHLQSEDIYKKIMQLKKDKGPLDDDFSIVELIFDNK